MRSLLRPVFVLFGVLSLLCGVLYPVVVSAIGALAFPHQVQGSLLSAGARPVGSSLIGQAFSAPGYFWGRPSATAPMPNNASASGGANLGPSNPALIDAVRQRVARLRQTDPAQQALIPVDLVTSSASGLDPDISVAAAEYQVARIAAARHLAPAQLRALIARQRQGPLLGLLGEARVNVLALNLALDGIAVRPN